MNNEDKNFIWLTPFKMQVIESFPFIDADFDALTNYELLCKVVEYINKVSANQNILDENNQALYNGYLELKDYVDNYFDNLDVTEEINNKLDAMAEDGYFDDIVKSYLKTFDLYISNFPKEEGETDDSGRLQRIVDKAIENKNANVVIDEVIHVSETTDIQYVTGDEQITISGFNENTAKNNMFWGSQWHELTNGIYASGNISVFEIKPPTGQSMELQGIKFSKLAIVNETYTRPVSGTDFFTAQINGIKFDRATIRVEDCYFYGMYNAIYQPHSDSSYADNVVIKNTDIHYYINSAITLSRADSSLIECCNFIPFNDYHSAVYLRASKGVKMISNTFANWGHIYDNEWVKCNAHSSSNDDSGTFVVFSYDSNVSIDMFHSEHHNGSALFYAKGGNVIINSLSNPLCHSHTVLARYNGSVTLMNSTISYVQDYSPSIDVYAITGDIVVINSSRYDADGFYQLKTSNGNLNSHIANFPIFTGTVRITSTKVYLRSAYDSGNGQELTMDQYGDIKFTLGTYTKGRCAYVSIGYGTWAYAKANVNTSTNEVTLSLYGTDGTKATSLSDGAVNILII